MAFHVGQRVRCVQGDRLPQHELPDAAASDAYPVAGCNYTIRDVFYDPHYGRNLVRLVEIINPVKQYRLGQFECGYQPERFRPLRDTTHQVELLKSLLLPKPKKARERA